MQPSDIAVELRPRTPWEAIDLGLAMLQRWWRNVYAAHAVVLAAILAVALGVGWSLEKPWVALVIVWWLKPVCDRIVLHVLSRAVFGELQATRAALGAVREWLFGSALFGYLLLRLVPDFARSFNLPVVQLEGSRGAEARARRSLLGRRAHSYAVWLTIVCLHFEAVLYWSIELFASLLLPAKAQEARDFFEALSAGDAWTYADVLAYSGAVLILEPFYVAAGFALYLNRRTLLEGWDLEVALRRIGARAALIVLLALCAGAPSPALAQKDPKREIAEVLKAPEFPHEREALRWVLRTTAEPAERKREIPDFSFGAWLAKVARVVLWALVAAALAYALWWLVRMLPRARMPARSRYEAPAALFGMELAPQSLPPDVPAAATRLAREGKMREALALLYRASLSTLIHQRGVELRASHTEMEVLALAPSPYLEELIESWRACAYADRLPAPQAVEQLARGYASL